jgi:3-hydroxyisobutyrate dehydrogenase
MIDAAYPVGFIGLGTMGEAMALTLVKAGTRFPVWNRTRAKAEILASRRIETESCGVGTIIVTIMK